MVTNAFAAKHPEVVTAWIKAQDQAVGQARTAPDQAAKSIGAELGLQPEEAKRQLSELVLLSAKEQPDEAAFGRSLAVEELGRTAN